MNHRSSPAAIDLAVEADFTLGSAKVRPALLLFSLNGTNDLLEPRIMQVLVMLARRSGGAVSRHELMDACWSGRVVGEDALERAISRLRKIGEERDVFEIKAIPRVGYRLRVKDGSDGGSAEPVLAVLAFENLSPDPTIAYFSEGISDEILQTLARARRIKVIGRTSSFQYRGQDKTIPKIAAELGVTHILDGSVRCADGRIRVHAQLIDAREQTVLWSAEYERPAHNM